MSEQKESVEEPQDQANEPDKAKNSGENDELDQLKEKNTGLQEELQEAKDKYLRLFAEFDNFKRRNAKERIELIQNAGEDLMVNLLPVLDDFDRGLKQIEQANDLGSVREGVELIHQKLVSTLEQKGLKPMKTLEETFNPEFHEAITEIPAPKKKLKGKIVDEIERGYYLNDKIIRYPKVVVGK